MKLVDMFKECVHDAEMPYGTVLLVNDNKPYHQLEIYKSETWNETIVILYIEERGCIPKCRTLNHRGIPDEGLTRYQLNGILMSMGISIEDVSVKLDRCSVDEYYKGISSYVSPNKYIEPTSIVTYRDQTFIITYNNLRLVIMNVDNGEYTQYDTKCSNNRITYRHLQTWLWGKDVDKIEYHGTLNEWLDK